MAPTSRRAQLSAAGLGAVTLALLALVWWGVSKLDAPRPVPVEKLEVALVAGVTGVLAPEDVERLFRELTEQSGQFELVLPASGSNARARKEGDAERVNGVRLSLELEVRRGGLEALDAPPENGEGVGEAAALADITVSRRQDGIAERYLATGRGRADGPTAIRDAVRAAMSDALVHSAALARALDASNAKLEKQARSKSAAERLAAITLLGERGHPAAAEHLLEQLRMPDAVLVRRAVGGLVRLRERRAVPIIIEISRGKSPIFQREMLYALAEIGGEEAEAYLFTVAEGHDDSGLQRAAQQALEQLGRRKEKERR